MRANLKIDLVNLLCREHDVVLLEYFRVGLFYVRMKNVNVCICKRRFDKILNVEYFEVITV